MKVKAKKITLLLLFTALATASFSQSAISGEVSVNHAQQRDSSIYLSQYTKHKKLPAGYEKEAIAALSYFPELRDVTVKFRVKKSFATLKTRPDFVSIFMPEGHRSYVITISDKTIQKLSPITFKNLTENARIGVLGHELSHVADFSKKTTWQSFKIAAGHL